MSNIAIFASGSGSNAENLVKCFYGEKSLKVAVILTNRSDGFVLKRAKKLSIESKIFNRNDFYETDRVLNLLFSYKVDFIVLAGFLWLVPGKIINEFPGKIINIHPALLPAYGGKGMYGSKVHKAVIANGEVESGITIHYVNEEYDAGDIIFQAKCELGKDDTPETLASKVHELELRYFPEVVHRIVGSQCKVDK